MARKRTPAQRAAEKTYDKTRQGRVVATRLNDVESKAFDARRGDQSANAFLLDLIRREIGINAPPDSRPKRRRPKQPS